MADAIRLTRPAARRGESVDGSAARYLACALAVMAAAALLAGRAPLAVSVATVFLFAGPHNWIELRFFLARLPARWGRSRPFFLVALAGVVVLAAGFAALGPLARTLEWSEAGFRAAVASWLTALLLWLATLVFMRGKQSPRRDWSLAYPIALALVALAWIAPQLCALAVVYAHPLVSLWLLDGELGRSRPAWRRAHRACLALLPAAIGLLWWWLADSPQLAVDGPVALRVAQHAGADVLPRVSSHLLVSTHVFLETLHYGVWLAAVPAAAGAASVRAPWRLDSIPLVRHPRGWPRAIPLALAVAAAAVVLLWCAFATDYATTRDVYFTLAVVHVLAEAPFLLRTL